MLQSGEALAIDKDASEHEHFLRAIDWDHSGVPSTLLVAPIKSSSGQIAGMLTAGRRSDGGFTIEERSLLEMAGRTYPHSGSNPPPATPLQPSATSHPAPTRSNVRALAWAVWARTLLSTHHHS